MLVTILMVILCVIPMGLLKSMIVKSMVGKTSRLTFKACIYVYMNAKNNRQKWTSK
jgi:hypothetical protein